MTASEPLWKWHVEDYCMDLDDRARQAYSDCKEWFGDSLPNDLGHQALGLGGECGELQNQIKKVERDGSEVESILPALTDELVDVLVYAFGIAGFLKQHFQIDLEEEYDKKRRYNQGRFGTTSTSSGE